MSKKNKDDEGGGDAPPSTKERRERQLRRLREIYARHKTLTPTALVIADARNPDSPLHDAFEWDIHKAAEEAWKERARELIRSFQTRITVEHAEVIVPFFVHDPNKAPHEEGYMEVSRVADDEIQKRKQLHEEIERAGAIFARVEGLAIYFGLAEHVQDLMDRFKRLKKLAKAV